MEIINNRINRIFNQNSFINELDNSKYNISSCFYDDDLQIITTPLKYNIYTETNEVNLNDNYSKLDVILNNNNEAPVPIAMYNDNSTQTTFINTRTNYTKPTVILNNNNVIPIPTPGPTAIYSDNSTHTTFTNYTKPTVILNNNNVIPTPTATPTPTPTPTPTAKATAIYRDNSSNTESDVIYKDNSTQTTLINTHENYKKILYFLIIRLLLKQRHEIFNYKKIIKNYLEYNLDISIYKIDTNYYNRVCCALYDVIIYNFKSIIILGSNIEGDLTKGLLVTQNITSRMNYYKIIYDRENDDVIDPTTNALHYDLDKLQEIYVRFSNNQGKLYTDYIKEQEKSNQVEINDLAGIDDEEEDEDEDLDLDECGCIER